MTAASDPERRLRVSVRGTRTRTASLSCAGSVAELARSSAVGEKWPPRAAAITHVPIWTVVITWHLRRPPVASALAALDGIRRGLHVPAAAPADAFASDRRRAAPLAYGCPDPERSFGPLEVC